MPLLILLVIAAAIWFDYIPRRKDGEKKMLWAYGILMAVSAAVLLLVSFGVRMPSLLDPVRMAVEAFRTNGTYHSELMRRLLSCRVNA